MQVRRSQLQGLVLPLPLALVSPVLEPDLDLGGRQFEDVGQLLAFGRREVALLLKPSLQLVDLGLREEDPGFPAGPLPGRLRRGAGRRRLGLDDGGDAGRLGVRWRDYVVVWCWRGAVARCLKEHRF